MHLFLTSAFGPAAALAHAHAAEHHGLGGVWLAEHHFVHYGQCPSATVLAGAILGSTSRLVVGTAACVFSARNPIALGEEALVLHALYRERFQLGVARGGPWLENDLLGGGMQRYERDFPGWLDTLVHWLRGIGPAPVVPFPGGAVTVRVAATSMATVETAAKRGLPLLLGVDKTPAEVARMISHWHEIADVEQADHARIVLAYPHDSRASAERELRRTLPAWLARRGTRDWTDYVEHLLRISPIGPAEEIIPTLQGLPRPLFMVEAAGSIEATTDLIATLACLRSS